MLHWGWFVLLLQTLGLDLALERPGLGLRYQGLALALILMALLTSLARKQKSIATIFSKNSILIFLIFHTTAQGKTEHF